MKIGGFLKQSFSDFSGQVAAIIFTQGCNLRCPYCHNPGLIDPQKPAAYQWETIWEDLKKRRRFLDGVVVSGGEPFLQSDLEEVMLSIRSLGLKLKLDTNGTFPEKLRVLVDQNLIDYVAMDIKASSALFQKAAGRDIGYHKIIESINILTESQIPYEFRSTLIEGIHDLDEMDAMARNISGAEIYFLQTLSGFDALDPDFLKKQPYSKAIMEQFHAVASNYVERCFVR